MLPLRGLLLNKVATLDLTWIQTSSISFIPSALLLILLPPVGVPHLLPSPSPPPKYTIIYGSTRPIFQLLFLLTAICQNSPICLFLSSSLTVWLQHRKQQSLQTSLLTHCFPISMLPCPQGVWAHPGLCYHMI